MNEADTCSTKPPDYETVIAAPPSYDVAIKLNPAQLLSQNQCEVVSIPEQPDMPPPSYNATSQPR